MFHTLHFIITTKQKATLHAGDIIVIERSILRTSQDLLYSQHEKRFWLLRTLYTAGCRRSVISGIWYPLRRKGYCLLHYSFCLWFISLRSAVRSCSPTHYARIFPCRQLKNEKNSRNLRWNKHQQAFVQSQSKALLPPNADPLAIFPEYYRKYF